MENNATLRFLKNLVKIFWSALLFILYGWIVALINLFRENADARRRRKFDKDLRKRRKKPCAPKCAVVNAAVYKRADPLIYSQKYLMEQGMSVTWNNPDIQLYKNGTPVTSSQLEMDTDYDIVATIYNNSTQAPAAGMPVEFSYLDFGIGTAKINIGSTIINVPVKGSPNHPVNASTTWHTPNVAGHYCLQVDLQWSDDANPKNNLGQENTNVGKFSSPAVFEFPLHNDDTVTKRIHLTADCYTLPKKLDCKEKPKKESSRQKYKKLRKLKRIIPPLEEGADWVQALNRHGVGNFPIPAGWSVLIEPQQVTLAPDQTEKIKVTLTPPEKFKGEKTININGFHGKELIGGVTLTASS